MLELSTVRDSYKSVTFNTDNIGKIFYNPKLIGSESNPLRLEVVNELNQTD
jgi:hypothetical protein